MKYLIKIAYIATLFVGTATYADTAIKESNFFANPSVQNLKPEAFVLQPETEEFLKTLHDDTAETKKSLVKAIMQDPKLYKAIQNWETLSIEQQIPYLKQIFDLEVRLMNIAPPELIIDSKEIPGRAAYFDFDINKPSPGRVILNPEVLKGMNKYASLSLLLHETRHSAQFQVAFMGHNKANIAEHSIKTYRAAFQAQKTMKIRSFCDFLTLTNEFEAFEFANSVLGKLTAWKIDLSDMGTFASQYNEKGELKINLVELLNQGGSKTLLEKFNDQEVPQCHLLGYCK